MITFSSRATWRAIAVAALALSGLSACGESGGDSVATGCNPKFAKFETKEAGVLNVAAVNYPPAITVTDGKVGGFDGETINAIAKAQCLKVKVLTADIPGVIQAVQSGRVDMSATDLYLSKERKKVVDYAGSLYLDKMAILSKEGFSTLEELEGKKVGDTNGSAYIEDVGPLIGKGYKLYSTIDLAQQDAKTGRLDASIGSAAAMGPLAKSGAFPGFKVVVAEPDERVELLSAAPQVGFIVRKGNNQLADGIAEVIASMKADGSLEKIFTKFGVDPSLLDSGAPRYF